MTEPQQSKTKTTRIKRLELRLAFLIGGTEKNRIGIATPEAIGYYLEDSFPLNLPIDIAAFIHSHCRCTYCDRPIARDLRRCACGKPENEGMQMEVEYATALYWSVFKPILNRESGCIKAVRRKQRLEENGGSHTRDDIVNLYEIQ